mgnify:CR=1 FL=1
MKHIISVLFLSTFLFVILVGAGTAKAYIGPGLGVVAAWALLGPIAAVILAILILAYFPLRYYYKKYKHKKVTQSEQDDEQSSDER